jgi:uncharacterized phage protein (TIGR01671 family)
MIRKLKFRAWNGREMRTGFAINSDGSNTANEKWIIMQFTGLLDKNGKGIYEGDIVIKKGYIWFDENEPNYRGTVEWVYSQWQIVAHCINPKKQGISDGINEGINDEGIDEGKKSGWKIIGNIYENPKLLIKEL